MVDRLQRWLAPTVMAIMAAVIVVGIVTAPPLQRDRTDTLAQQLRCPVCQGESVADSPSETAEAMREQIDQMVTAGHSDSEILAHYVARYGRWILLDPPARGDTLWLWVLPVLAAAAGIATLVGRQRRDGTVLLLDEAERALVQREVAALRHREDHR